MITFRSPNRHTQSFHKPDVFVDPREVSIWFVGVVPLIWVTFPKARNSGIPFTLVFTTYGILGGGGGVARRLNQATYVLLHGLTAFVRFVLESYSSTVSPSHFPPAKIFFT